GAGLERVAAVLQGVYSNYDTDLFVPLIQSIEKATQQSKQDKQLGPSFRVIADHLRASTFLIHDGVLPSNEGRGYVLRRILRRAIRHGKLLGQEQPFLYRLIPNVADGFKTAYPDLVPAAATISETIREEELKFHETIHRGMGLLEDAITGAQRKGQTRLAGD